MDQDTLVKSGHALVRHLDDTPAAPRLAMWVSFSDREEWRLWIVPSDAMRDKREFYEIVTSTILKFKDEMPAIDFSNVQYMNDNKPLVKAMGSSYHVPGLTNEKLSGNTVNGIYIPDGVLLRSNL
ncbi:hypothetical protein [Rhizobium sp.]